MKTSICLMLSLVARSLAADVVPKVQSAPHEHPARAISDDLIQGIAGIGKVIGGSPVPCLNCFGAPGVVAVPPAYQIVDTSLQIAVNYYYVVETLDQGGNGISTVDLTEISTGTVIQHLSAPVTLVADSTNLVVFSTMIPSGKNYQGPATLTFTTTLGASTAQGTAFIWLR